MYFNTEYDENFTEEVRKYQTSLTDTEGVENQRENKASYWKKLQVTGLIKKKKKLTQ